MLDLDSRLTCGERDAVVLLLCLHIVVIEHHRLRIVLVVDIAEQVIARLLRIGRAVVFGRDRTGLGDAQPT